MFPKAENVSYRALLSMESSRFLINTFPTPDFLSPGSRWDHMIRMGRPLITSKFMVSRARSAGKEVSTKGENNHRDGPPSPSYSTGIRGQRQTQESGTLLGTSLSQTRQEASAHSRSTWQQSINLAASSSLADAQVIYWVTTLVSRATNPTPPHRCCLPPK